jgi:ABC-2 type transport system ATP-binding protein
MEKYLKKLDLWEKRNHSAQRLSGGMKRRLMIARALIHEPQMLILDEPTAGVDIEIRHSMWEFFTELNKQGITIILTTHYLEEAENLCRRVAIIDHGKIITDSLMSQLLRTLDKESFVLYLNEPYKILPHIESCTVSAEDSQTLEVEMPRTFGVTSLIIALQKQGLEVATIRNKSNRLEKLFIELTRRDEPI